MGKEWGEWSEAVQVPVVNVFIMHADIENLTSRGSRVIKRDVLCVVR